MAVVHEAMAGSAQAMARVSGMADYPFVTVDYPHVPLAVWTPDEVRAIAHDLAPRVLERLTDPGRVTERGGRDPDAGATTSSARRAG